MEQLFRTIFWVGIWILVFVGLLLGLGYLIYRLRGSPAPSAGPPPPTPGVPGASPQGSHHEEAAKRDDPYFRQIGVWAAGIGLGSYLLIGGTIGFVLFQFGKFENRGIIIVLISTLVWTGFMALASSWFYITLPEYIGWVTVDLLSGKKRIYPDPQKGARAGTFAKLPTELKKAKNRVDLEGTTIRFDMPVSVSDGGGFTVTVSFRERPRLSGLDRYIGVDRSTIQTGFADAFITPIARKIQRNEQGTPRTTEDALTKIGAIQDDIVTAFEGRNHALEEEWGVDFDNLFIKIEPTKETSELLKKKLGAKTLAESIQELISQGLTPAEAKDAVLIEAGKMGRSVQATENFAVWKIDLGGAHGDKIAEALVNASQNPAVAGAVGAALGAGLGTKNNKSNPKKT